MVTKNMKEIDRLDPAVHGWLSAAPVRQLFSIVASAGGQARVVGGAVRDALLGIRVHDIDFATDLLPQQVIEVFGRHGIKTAPTGIEFGTVTVVLDGKGYEVTTFRQDIQTDGRHAVVAYTKDWRADAARRDFTFNALYVDQDGRLDDPFQGREDLAAGRVRFIGYPHERIREDSLRILRAFRFLAQLSASFPDGRAQIAPESLSACREMAPFLSTLSRERVWHEWRRLLEAQDPTPTCSLMIEKDILSSFLPDVRIARADRLARLIAAERHAPPLQHDTLKPLRRFVALMDAAALDPEAVRAVAKSLKMSKKEAAQVANLSSFVANKVDFLSTFDLRQTLYDHGPDVTLSAYLLNEDHPAAASIALIEGWKKPVFPLSGAALMKKGVPAGPEMGEILKKTEAWWRMKDFEPTKEACIIHAIELINN